MKKNLAEVEEERNRLQRAATAHTSQVDKMRKTLEDTRTQLDLLESEKGVLKKVRVCVLPPCAIRIDEFH